MHDSEQERPRERYPRTLWMYLREGMVAAHKRRPVSFYLLLAMPAPLLLAVGLLDDRENVQQFTLGLCLLFACFGAIMIRAVSDLFDITRRHLRANKSSFRDTLGDEQFINALGSRVKQAGDE